MDTGSPKDIARDFAYMMVARGVALGVSFVRSLIVPGLLGPHFYGMWKTLGLIQTYAKFGDLGSRAALRREIPYYTGKSDPERLAAVRDVAFTANNLAILVAGAATFVAAFLIDDPALRAAMLVFLPMLYFEHIYAFLELFLLARKEFAWQSRLNVWINILEAALAIALTWAYGLPGLIWGTTLSFAIAVLVQLRHTRFAMRLRWRWGMFKELVVVGFPSHLNGLLYNIFLSIDRWLILSLLGLTSLGYYALGMTINEYLFQLSYTFGNVLSPRLVERYSEREQVADLRGMVETPLTIISRVSPALLGVVYFGAEAVIRGALPDYVPGILPLQILLVGTFFSSVPRGLSSFFITLRRQAQTVVLYVVSIGVNLALVWSLIHAGYGLAGAAIGTSTSLALLGLALVVMALRYFMGAAAIARFLVHLLWPLLVGAALVWGARAASGALAGPEPTVLRLALGAVLFSAAYSPVLIHLYRSHRHQLGPAA